ncbi:hypothetical protein [Flavobacterium gilvum]|uniref:hypothetical protein n=1 Tax=Flavobacterium gilvum TaxID=1492737 RepID=UPI0012E01656|nr:hypothetical protein [Flavobacterium gilvum]
MVNIFTEFGVKLVNRNRTAFEFKWASLKKVKLPKPFEEAYQPKFLMVTKENFREFLK